MDVDGRGNLYVLDSGTGIVSQFDSELNFTGDLPIDTVHLSRARGIDVDDSGGLWIATTPSGQLIRYDLETSSISSVQTRLHLASHGEAQPVDVLATDSGSVYSTDAGVHMLSRYEQGGMLVWTTAIPIANTYHGSHLTADPSGFLLMSEPETGTVAQVDESGNLINRWSLRTHDGSPVKPVGVTVDEAGRVWVADAEGGRVLSFTLPAEVSNGSRSE